MISTLILVFVFACSTPPEPDIGIDCSSLKIAAPPNGGIYLGQHEWRQWESPDDIETFEAAVGRKVALFSVLPMAYGDSGFSFQPEIAEEAWQKGRMVQVHGLGASPMEAAENEINGFTVDRLLKGEFDDKIHQLALQFKQFAKPMFFFTTREPNGIGQDWFGGFGINGDKNLQWALDNQKGLAEYEGVELPNEEMLQKLRDLLDAVNNIAPEKPIIIIEMGFGTADDTQDEIAQKVSLGLSELMKYPQINAFAMWSQSSPEVDPFNFLIRPDTPGGEAFQRVIDDNPTYFHSCVYFSDGSQMPTCAEEGK